jgi:hypothetical protein
MFLNVGFLDLGGGGEPGAERMAAEREPALALGKVAPEAGSERAFLDEPDDVLVGQPRPRNPAVLARDRPEQGPWPMRPSRSQVSRRATGQVSGREPRPISTSRQPVLRRMVRSAPSGTISIQPEPSSV